MYPVGDGLLSHMLIQLVFRENGPRVLRQDFQKGEFFYCQWDFLTIEQRFLLIPVNGQAWA